MRAPLISVWVAAAGLAVAGCASSPPQEDPPVTFTDHTCSGEASDPLHLTSNKTVAERGDPEIESILTQHGDPRLVWVNRSMYQSLHALDVELRREQRIAACERSQSGSQTLEAQASAGSKNSTGSAAASTGAGGGVVALTGGSAGGVATGGTAMSAAAAYSTLVRKSNLPSAGAGGNGATMPKVVAGSDNDIVARRLRKAAEQETDPTLRKKLWKEYADYRQEIAVK